eukprot:gene26557-biopygen12920
MSRTKPSAGSHQKARDTITELERYENLIGNKIGKVFMDNAREYNCTEFTTWFKNKGITQEFTIPGNASTNGAAERLNRTLHDRSTALLLTSKFPNKQDSKVSQVQMTRSWENMYQPYPVNQIWSKDIYHLLNRSGNIPTDQHRSGGTSLWNTGSKAIGAKWVFDLKRLVSGEIDRFKARLVAKGYAQRPGMDYEEVFAPVAKLATIRFILSMAAFPAAHLAQLDVSTAFLNGIVEEEIYCTQPPGFEKEHKVCRMWKYLYGLKQASRQWYLKVKEDMMGIGFK